LLKDRRHLWDKVAAIGFLAKGTFMRKLTVVGFAPLIVALGCGVEEEPASRLQNREAAAPYERIDQATLKNSAFVPRSLGSTRETFIVKLAGDPVAKVQGDAGVKLLASQKETIRAQLTREQAAVEPGITALGGRIQAHYRDAYNGMRVQIQTSQLPALRNLPGVVSVHRLHQFVPNNVNGAQRVNAPGAWSPFAGLAGFRGEGVKVAILDTGIDYTHADFGGPGTVDAFEAAFSTSTAPADPALFGPAAPKVKGGIDLVGDAYDASTPETDIPQPDDNPLDCNGHGSHVAGTAAGFGVANGATFAGPYDADTYTANSFDIGPGVAPLADLYAVRVFGCVGSTNVVVDALDWAVANDMDVVNMSLGSPFGGADDPSAEASDNAVRAGVIVVASAGNSGVVDFITGSPASSSAAISVAAQDPAASFPGASVSAAGGSPTQTINANGAALPSAALEVEVLLDAAGAVSLGCDPAEYVNVTGKLVVVKRGVCARVARAVFGQQAGAAAVLMINNANALPPFEGRISGNPDTGEAFNVTIPFLGTSLANEAAVRALDGQVVSIANAPIPNPSFNTMAGFSALGPRLGDGHLKPDVTAPGLAIRSVAIGAGNGAAVLSGTSMAAPHTTGLAALVRQAHPNYSAAQIKAAVINTAQAGGVVAYSTRRAGAGVVNAANAAHTNVIAYSAPREVHVNLGVLEVKNDYIKTKVIRLFNRGRTDVNFTLRAERPQGSPHAVSISPRTVTVPAGANIPINVTIAIDAATAGNSDAFHEVAGLIIAAPGGGGNAGIPLSVPYYGVIRPAANVNTTIKPKLSLRRTSSTATVTNVNSEIPGIVDVYAWGLSDGAEDQGYVDIRGVGAQAFPNGASQLVVIAVNTSKAWSTPSLVEVDVAIDSNLDGTPDFVVIGLDLGQLNGTGFTGQIGAGVLDLNTGALTVQFLAAAPTNSSTILLPFDAALIGVTPENPRFAYSVATFDLNSADTDATDTTAVFNAFTSSVSQGDFLAINPNQVLSVPVALDPAEFAQSPALGHMIVTLDNLSGAAEADLITLAP
jgi:minor extracellular serine protease Vpr